MQDQIENIPFFNLFQGFACLDYYAINIHSTNHQINWHSRPKPRVGKAIFACSLFFHRLPFYNFCQACRVTRVYFCLQLLMFLFAGKEKEVRQPKPRFKQSNSLEQRISLRFKFEQKYPKDRYALVVLEGIDELEPSSKSFSILGIENHFTVLMLLEYIRLKILVVDNRQSFFLKIRNQIRRTSDNIGELFKRYAEEDGFLYIEIKKESIF